MRAVVDANVWVAALMAPGGPADAVLSAFMAGEFVSIVSAPVLSELATILNRPRIAAKCAVTPADVREWVRYMRARCEVVTVTGGYHLCRDPDDNKLIETAVRGRAPLIVSRDSDLADPALKEPLARLGIRVLVPEDSPGELRAERGRRENEE